MIGTDRFVFFFDVNLCYWKNELDSIMGNVFVLALICVTGRPSLVET